MQSFTCLRCFWEKLISVSVPVLGSQQHQFHPGESHTLKTLTFSKETSISHLQPAHYPQRSAGLPCSPCLHGGATTLPKPTSVPPTSSLLGIAFLLFSHYQHICANFTPSHPSWLPKFLVPQWTLRSLTPLSPFPTTCFPEVIKS